MQKKQYADNLLLSRAVYESHNLIGILRLVYIIFHPRLVFHVVGSVYSISSLSHLFYRFCQMFRL